MHLFVSTTYYEIGGFGKTKPSWTFIPHRPDNLAAMVSILTNIVIYNKLPFQARWSPLPANQLNERLQVRTYPLFYKNVISITAKWMPGLYLVSTMKQPCANFVHL